MRNDGSALRQLTDDPASDRAPHWSPDGQRIAFMSNRGGQLYQLWIMNPDGSGLRQITQETRGPVTNFAWSPDGQRIAYNLPRMGSFICQIDGPCNSNTATPLARAPQPDAWFWVTGWSPDRRSLAGYFVRLDGRSAGNAVYSLAKRQYRRISDDGLYSLFSGSSKSVIYLTPDGIWVADIVSGSSKQIYSSAPNRLGSTFTLSRQNRALYFTTTSSEADVWVHKGHSRLY
jgi:Tol biopolymer transport system component